MTRQWPKAGLVRVIARKQLADSVRDRWFWAYAAGFAILAALLVNTALPGAAATGYGAFGRSASSLVALVQLIVPLMGLTLGAQSIAGGRERGTLRFLLAHPVSRTEIFLGTYLGLIAAMFTAVLTGFGTAGVLTAIRGGGGDAATFTRLAALSAILAAAMVALGMLIGATARRSATAFGGALLTWLVLVFLGDLGIMGTAVSFDLPVSVLFASTVLNPVEAFRLATFIVFQGSLDVLGPAGTYAVDRYGDGLDRILIAVLVCWVLVPAAAAWFGFARVKDL